MFWRTVFISAWLLKDGAHPHNCKVWSRCLCAWTRFLYVAEHRLEFEFGGSYSLPCVISHAAYLLQILFFCGIQLFSALSIPSASLSTMDSKWEKGRIWVSLHSFSAEHFQPYSCMMRLLEPQRTYLLSAQGSISISAESLKIIKINGNRIYMCANYFFKEPKTAQHLPLPYILFIT